MNHRTRSWTVFAVMAVMYCFSQFYRMSTAVVAVDLGREFGLGPDRLSLLGGAFFYAFALVQIPLGLALDRWGAKWIVVGATLLGAGGSILFAVSSGWPGLLTGRVLMGLGMSPVLMGSFKLISRWFPATAFGSLSGLMLALGTLGSLLAATPLALLVTRLGWRGSFVLFGVLTLAASLAVACFVRDGDRQDPGTDSGDHRPLGGLRALLGLPSFWAMVPLALVGYASVASLQGLWAGPFFMESLGYSREITGNILLSLGLSTAAGSFAGGVLSDRLLPSRKWVVIGGSAAGGLFLLPLVGIAVPAGPGGWAWALAGFGFLSAFRALIYTHVKESVPPSAIGTAVTTVNFFIMVGPALLQQALGEVLVRRPGDYRAAFLLLVLALAAGIVAYLGTRDTHPTKAR